MGGEVATRQPLDSDAELAQSILREVDLSMLEGIFVTAADQERKLIAICLEEVTEVQAFALR